MTVSYFEWVQDIGRLFWTRDEIRAKLAEKLSDAFDQVWNLAEERDVSLRTAALVSGIREVSSRARGAGDISVNLVRDAMVSHPGRLPADASSRPTGELLQRPEVRAIYVTDEERLVGVVTRKTLVREVVAAGRDRMRQARRDRRTARSHHRPRCPARGCLPFPGGSTTPSASRSSTESGG